MHRYGTFGGRSGVIWGPPSPNLRHVHVGFVQIGRKGGRVYRVGLSIMFARYTAGIRTTTELQLPVMTNRRKGSMHRTK